MNTRLVSRTGIERIESRYPVLVDKSSSCGRAGLENLSDSWIDFKSYVIDGDEIWEYDSLSVEMGFAAGESGIAIVRDGAILRRFRLTATG